MTLQVFVPAAVYGLGQGAAAPIFALKALELGASAAIAGVIVALSGLGMVLGDLPAGRTVARIGERWSVAIGSVLGAVGVVLCICAWNVAVLGLGMLLMGVANAVWGLARQSYVVSSVRQADLGRALSTMAGSMRLGFFVGPFIGAVVVHWSGLTGGLWVQLVATLVAGALMVSLPDRGPPASSDRVGRSLTSVLVEHRKLLSTLGSGALLMGAARASRTALLPLWAAHIGMSAAATSVIFGISGAVDVLLSYPAGVLMDRYGRRAIAVPSMVFFAVGYAALPLSSNAIAVGAVAVSLGVANGLSNGVIMTIGADSAPPGHRAEFLGAWRLTHDIGMFTGPIVVGVISGVAVLGAAAVALGALSGLGAAAMHRWVREVKDAGLLSDSGSNPTSSAGGQRGSDGLQSGLGAVV
ncbi:MFS transporter [Antrihabitans sp. YC3-6]|uniref:MFS transporter n=1 Tax=Antrihabitans stalagmiti TaxID=2799499 RepID=A0A934NQL9_9NOCA|nr:MFS transporter [Antrihabitans stalagmiti]MBJ8339548.1 MFS transporter [Antrihabitans stalagmiti]